MKRFNATHVLLVLALVLSLMSQVEGGWWPFGKTTEQKRHAAVDHSKRAYYWGKEYGKDKVGDAKSTSKEALEKAKSTSKETYEKARAQAEHEVRENEKAMKQAKDKLEQKYDTLGEHAKKVAENVEKGYEYAKNKIHEAAEAGELTGSAEDLSERAERTGGLFQSAKDTFKARVTRGDRELKTFAERYAEEKAQTEERQRNWYR